MTEKKDGSSGSIHAMGHALLDRLNGPQKAAASHVEGALLVLAGPVS